MSELIYLDVEQLLKECSTWATTRNPLTIRVGKRGQRWGVELSVKKGKQQRRAFQQTLNRPAAVAIAVELRKRLVKELTHVA